MNQEKRKMINSIAIMVAVLVVATLTIVDWVNNKKKIMEGLDGIHNSLQDSIKDMEKINEKQNRILDILIEKGYEPPQ
jgi:uncharacterized protein YoxC